MTSIPRYIDNLASAFTDVNATSFNLDGTTADGYVLTSDSSGTGTWEIPPLPNSSAVYQVDPDFTSDRSWLREFQTIESCITYLNSLGPPALGSQYYIRLAAKTHLIFNTVTMPVSTLMYCESPGALTPVYAAAPMQAMFIGNTQTYFGGISFFGNELATHIIEIPEGVAVNTFDTIYGGSISHCIVSTINGSTSYGGNHGGSFTYFRVGILALDFTPAGAFSNNIGGYGFYNEHDNFGFFGYSSIISSTIFVINPLFHGLPFDFQYLGGSDSIHESFGLTLQNLTDVFTATDNSLTAITSGRCTGCTRFIVADSTATVRMQSCSASNATGNIIDVLSTTAVVSYANGIIDGASVNIPANGRATLTYFEENQPQQPGFHCSGSLVVGRPLVPGQAFFGTGGASSNGTAIFTFDSVGLTYTDLAPLLLIGNTTPISLYTNNSGDYLYVGEDNLFSTINAEVSAISDPTLYTVEYRDSLGVWQPVSVFNAQFNRPYKRYTTNLFTAVELQTIRLDLRVYNSDWTAHSVNGIFKYWVRIQNVNPFVSIPTALSLFTYFDTNLIDTNGVNVLYGRSRTYQSIPYDVNLTQSIPGSTAGNQDLYFGEFSRVGRERNLLNSGDVIGGCFVSPVNVDTSTPLRMGVTFISTSTAALQADFQVTVTTGITSSGDRVYLTAAAAAGNPIGSQQQTVFSLSPNQVNGQFLSSATLELDISNLSVVNSGNDQDELFIIDIERNADGNGNNLVLLQVSFIYLSFASGLII